MARVVIPAANAIAGTDKVLVRIGSEGIVREAPASLLQTDLTAVNSRLGTIENQWFPLVNASDAVTGVSKIGGAAKDFKPLVGNFRISSGANSTGVTPFSADGSGFALSSSITIPVASVPKTVRVTKTFTSGGTVSTDTPLATLDVSCSAGSTVIIFATGRSFISWAMTNPEATSIAWRIERFVGPSPANWTALTDWHSVCGWGSGISTVNDYAVSVGCAMTAYYSPSSSLTYKYRLIGEREYGKGICACDNIKFTVLEVQ